MKTTNKKSRNLKNLESMQKFTLKNIPDLDTCVLGALELFQSKSIPKINIKFKRPMVVGSGNAEATGKIIFRDYDAVFASESDYEEKIKKIKNIDGVVLVSASGAKHAPIIAQHAKKLKKKVMLLTNNKNADAKKYANETLVFPKQKEPYTYNTSTYMGLILAESKENPSEIYNFIKNNTDKIKLPDFSKYDKFYILVPTKFSGIIRMLQVKFIELFGRQVARDVETIEYIKHATTVVPSNELFISFGEENKTYGKNRLYVPLPKNARYGAMMAVSYYIIGKIQKSHKPYFKQNIEQYMKEASKIFKSEMKPIVE
jgi:hypothetical protein